MIGQIIAYAVGAAMTLWLVGGVAVGIYGYFVDEIKVARQHGEPAKLGILRGLDGITGCMLVGVLVVIGLIVVVAVARFIGVFV